MSQKFRWPGFVVFVSFIAALGGLMFGYNTSVISGAILFLTDALTLTSEQQALIISTLLIGALLGALIGGTLADKYGRKKTLLMTVAIFLIGTLLMTIAEGFSSLLIGRFVLGLAIGVVSLTAPLYIAEMSPTRVRGALVSFNQLAITIGILLAYVVNYGFAETGAWRSMFAFAFLPTLLMLIGLFFIPETPSWLTSQGKKGEAKKVLDKIGQDKCETNHASKGKFRDLFSKSIRPAFITGIGISVFQQITGINIVIYYAPKIFQIAGFASASSAIFASVGVGIVNVLVTVAALWLIDRLGRRPLLIIGLIGMTVCLAVLGLAFFINSTSLGMISIISVMAYVAFFAVSLGPVAWLIISEIFPLKVRGSAMGIAIFANWTCNYIVSLTFLNLVGSFGPGGTFWIYSLICLLGIFFVLRKVPETKNKTFEEIQEFWHKIS
jgi:MFS transporter, SP family, galactose:H+ symporter